VINLKSRDAEARVFDRIGQELFLRSPLIPTRPVGGRLIVRKKKKRMERRER